LHYNLGIIGDIGLIKILQIIDLLQWGGAQKMQVFLAEQLQNRDVELTIVSLNASMGSPVPEILRQRGMRVVVFPFPKFLSFRSFWRLFDFIRREKFDLIHTHLTYSNILGTIIGRMTGTPVIASLRTAGYDPRYHRWIRQFIETVVVLFGAQRIMANGQVVAELGRKRFFSRKIDVVPNAITLTEALPSEERNALRMQLTGDPTRPIVISVGRLDLPKGFPDLLNAFDLVRKTYPQAALLIAGDGPIREQLERQVKDLGLENHVFLLGERDDVGSLLGASDLYVTSSHWEGLPVSVLEAMAAGLPVIATTVGELPTLVVRQAGSLVPPREPERLGMEIIHLLSNPDRIESMGMAGREHIQKNFSPAVWVRQLLTLYVSVYPPAMALLENTKEQN
jgi:glycosyltransferase involved in cell wall biosynthesis